MSLIDRSLSRVSRRWRRTATRLVAVSALVVPLVVLDAVPGASAAPAAPARPKPNIVLVHGAFADSSGWTGVVNRLQDQGYNVIAPANPLRGVAADTAYLQHFLASVPGPIVLVGHSYGGFVLTNAAAGNPNVKALVYIAAFAPDQGDTVGGLSSMFPGSMLGPGALAFRTFPSGGAEPGTDAYIDPASFRAVFCADLSRRTANAMALTQRPANAASLAEPSGPAAWKTTPSWTMVATQDRVIPAAAQRFMAKRAGSTVVEVKASHVAMISQPTATTRLIVRAAKAVG